MVRMSVRELFEEWSKLVRRPRRRRRVRYPLRVEFPHSTPLRGDRVEIDIAFAEGDEK